MRKERNYKFAKGTTAVLRQKVITKEEIGRYVTVHELGSEKGSGNGNGSDSDSLVVVEKMDIDEACAFQGGWWWWGGFCALSLSNVSREHGHSFGPVAGVEQVCMGGVEIESQQQQLRNPIAPR